MTKLGLVAALALATAAPAMAMTSSRDNHTATQAQEYAASPTVVPMSPKQCLRRIDAFGNIHVVCPNRSAARAAWMARRSVYPGNFTVYYRNGGRVVTWNRWTRRPRR